MEQCGPNLSLVWFERTDKSTVFDCSLTGTTWPFWRRVCFKDCLTCVSQKNLLLAYVDLSLALSSHECDVIIISLQTLTASGHRECFLYLIAPHGEDVGRHLSHLHTPLTNGGEIPTHSLKEKSVCFPLKWMNQSSLCRLSHSSYDWQLLCGCQEADCGSSAPALRAAEPLEQWSLLPPCMWCVKPHWPCCRLTPARARKSLWPCCLFSISHSC